MMQRRSGRTCPVQKVMLVFCFLSFLQIIFWFPAVGAAFKAWLNTAIPGSISEAIFFADPFSSSGENHAYALLTQDAEVEEPTTVEVVPCAQYQQIYIKAVSDRTTRFVLVPYESSVHPNCFCGSFPLVFVDGLILLLSLLRLYICLSPLQI